jgi:hypothetical protein
LESSTIGEIYDRAAVALQMMAAHIGTSATRIEA